MVRALLNLRRPLFVKLFAISVLAASAFTASSVQAQTLQAQASIAPSSNYERALTCLTQAISYEAGNEPLSGQEAVAQVILNRMRHPAYPSTVCGVVYQGSERKTGCQFTFTCDGSLLRGRSAASLSRARLVAEQVLAGRASTLVGGATHYHADYVSPYWAPSLVKVATIGAHIFYRMPGAPDSPAIVLAANLQNEPLAKSSLIRETGLAKPVLAETSTSRPVFSPWGLPVLAITADGKLQATGR